MKQLISGTMEVCGIISVNDPIPEMVQLPGYSPPRHAMLLEKLGRYKETESAYPCMALCESSRVKSDLIIHGRNECAGAQASSGHQSQARKRVCHSY